MHGHGEGHREVLRGVLCLVVYVYFVARYSTVPIVYWCAAHPGLLCVCVI
jgi:hypothetical protein